MIRTLLSTEEMCPSGASTSTIDTNPILSTSKLFTSRLKCVILAFFIFIGVGNVWGQTTTLDFDTDGDWTAVSVAITSYGNHTYAKSNWSFQGANILRNGTTAQDGFAGALGTYSWRLRDAASTSLTATFNSSATISSFGFDVRRWDNAPDPNFTVEYTVNSGSNWTNTGTTINNTYLGSSNWKTYTFSLPSATAVTSGQFRIRIVRSSGERIFIDNFQWTVAPAITNYSVTFNGNGSTSGTMSNQTASSPTNLITNAFLRTGYSFAGWNTAAIGTGTAYANGASYAFTANATLYAQWTANSNTITFDGNGATGGSTASQNINTAASANLTANGFTRTGYSFSGWNTASNGTGSSYADQTNYSMGTANVTLYAQWTANTLNVTYDSQSGSSISPGSTTTGGAVSDPGIPTRSGYSFSGWFVAPIGGSAISFPYTHNQTADFTLYAQWTAASLPTLSAATLSSALSTTYGTPSTGVGFTVSGSNLTGNITATAQTGYEVSTNNSSFSNSVDVASGTTVYVRFSATQTAGSYNGATAVVLTSSGATAQNVTTSGSGNEVSKATPSINSSPTATAITYGQTLASSTLSGGSASVVGSFAFTTPSAAPNGGTANQSVTFTPIDNANYNTTTTNVSVTVNKADQTISFGALANKTTTDPAFSLTATASSGLAVSYSSSNTTVATIVGSTVTIQGAGTTTITASQAGDGNYNAATSVVQTLTVTQAPQGIFTEDMRTPSATTSIASHTFQNSPTFTYTNGGATNSADVRNTSPSSGYTGASGNGNVFFTSTSGNYGFAIEGIDASTYTNLEVRFAYRKENATVLPNFTLDYWNGSSYVNLPFSFNESANAAIGWYFVNWIALPSGAQISSLRLRWVKAGGQSVRLDDVTLRGIINTSPLILVSPNSLSGFSQNSSTPSAEQSYTVSGDNLTNDVIITPPTGFEISTSTGGSFSATNPITLTASGGNLVGEPVTIYVRQSASTLGSVSGNIAHSSTGSNNPNVAISGTRTGSYYSKSSGNLDEVGTWGINTDGSGSSPSNFSSDGIVYEIRNRTTATIGANWTITGTASKVLVGDGTNATDFTIPSNYTLTGTIDVSTNAELTIENTTSPTLGTLASNSTLEYNNLAVTLSTAVTYRNLKLTGTGAKTFPGGTTTITGNLIFDNCVINGGSGPFSTILLAGNLTYSGAVTSPADANSITLSTNGTASGTQTITGAGNTVRWFRIQTTTAHTILFSTTGGSSNLLLGNASGGGLNLVNGSVLNMNGNDFTLFSSTSNSAAFVLNSTGSISATSTTDFTLQRTGNGNLGTIRFSDGANTIGSLTLNHTGSTNNRLDLGSALTIADNLVLTAGKLDILGNTLTIGTASNVGTISGTLNNNNYIVAYDNGSGAIGKVQRYVHPTSNTSYSFPIGDNNRYAPITYTNTGGTAAEGAYLLVHTKPSKIPQLNSSITNYLNRYWEVEPMGITSPDYSIQFSYESTDIVGPTNSAFIPIKYSNTTWYRPINTLNTSGTAQGMQGNTAANTLQWNDLTSFSQFSAIADQATPLPIELISFQANCKDDNSVSVTWTTASEHNTGHYEVEKSRDGINWSELGQTAAAGNSTQLLNYEMIDSEKASGTTYYRLTQFDNDGVYEVFDPVSVNCNGTTSNNHITTYPNPSSESFYVSLYTETMEGNGQLTITDASGRPVYQKSVTIQDGNNVFHIGDWNAAPGMYYIQVSNGTTTTDIVKHSLR